MGAESSSFELLAEPVRRWIWDRNWSALQDIQEEAIPLLLRDAADVIIAAPTASGKTEAAFLPLISKTILAEGRASGFDLMYVSPLKALINDQFRRLEELCNRVDLPVHPWHGDVSAGAKARARRNPQGILLITPESLEALFVLRGTHLPGLFGKLDCIVVDELHALLDNERGVHLRSLLNRLELAAGRQIRRAGLSATLGDMALAKGYLRPEAPDQVRLITSEALGARIRLQVRGYTVKRVALQGAEEPLPAGTADREPRDATGPEGESADLSAIRGIATHLLENLRGSQNLVFAGSRNRVERFADYLARMSERAKLPLEFYPHHANLAKEHREFVELRLKEALEPTTAVCTSTLELGIDIGQVESVAQIEAPFSVASLRQRLGRSGRRRGKPAVLRVYTSEKELEPALHPVDALRLNLVRAVALVELLLDRWCEPPRTEALHLSTLVQQILSVVAERGGARADALYRVLCERGPFHKVSQELFIRVLRCLGNPEAKLLEQAPDGTLLLGEQGERLVEHYSFFAVFATPEEFHIVCDGKTLGTMPVLFPLAPGMTIIFSGRRWRITEIRTSEKVVAVVGDASGSAPVFGGDAGPIHDRVIGRMRDILSGEGEPRYLDESARALLAEARRSFRRFGLHRRSLFSDGRGGHFVATWKGTAKTFSLLLALKAQGMRAALHDGLVEVAGVSRKQLQGSLEQLARAAPPSGGSLAAHVAPLQTEKYHPYLSDDILAEDVVASRLAPHDVPSLAARVLQTG